jgi:hypothetical protein
MLTTEEIERHDQRNAAIHEAGHLTVAVALGIRGARSHLVRTNDPDLRNSSSWVGQTQISGRERPEVSIAGVVAECLNQDCLIEADEIAYYIDEEVLAPSPSDWRAIPRDDPEALLLCIENAIDLLCKHKQFFEWAVAELLEGDVITDGMAAKKFAELCHQPRRQRAGRRSCL